MKNNLIILINMTDEKLNQIVQEKTEKFKQELIAELKAEQQEQKPSQLFYDNGAVVNELEPSEKYWHIGYYGDVCEARWSDRFCSFLSSNQNVFLTKEAAEKWLDVKNTHNRLLAKIKQIDAENNWKADWSNANQLKYEVAWNYFSGEFCGEKDYSDTPYFLTGSVYMSEQSKDYMMSDEVSDEDFKKFLLIVE
jgi:hypothetical protein